MFCSKTPMSPSGKIRSRSSLLSRSLFLGSIPETAWRMIYRGGRVGVGTGSGQIVQTTHLIGLSPHHILVLYLLQPSGEHRVVPVHELLGFLPGNFNVTSIRHDDVVSTVGCTARLQGLNVHTILESSPPGSKMGLCLPMRTIAMRSASFPSTRSEAST